jgi:hypothetical protein
LFRLCDTYYALDVLWREELWDRHRALDGTEEAIRLRLVPPQGGEELLHLGCGGLQAGELVVGNGQPC